MKKLFLFLFVTLFAISNIYTQDLNSIKKTIQKNNAKFCQLMIENKFEEMMEFFSDDIISMPSYSPVIRGAEAMAKTHEMQKESGVKTTAFNLTTTDVLPAGEYYIEIGTYTITMDIPNMKMPWSDHGKYLNVWKTDDEGLLELVIETWNTDVNPWMDMQGMEESDPMEMGKPDKMKEDKNEEEK